MKKYSKLCVPFLTFSFTQDVGELRPKKHSLSQAKGSRDLATIWGIPALGERKPEASEMGKMKSYSLGWKKKQKKLAQIS